MSKRLAAEPRPRSREGRGVAGGDVHARRVVNGRGKHVTLFARSGVHRPAGSAWPCRVLYVGLCKLFGGERTPRRRVRGWVGGTKQLDKRQRWRRGRDVRHDHSSFPEFNLPDATPDLRDATLHNACGTECGPVELCDEAHLGLDDNCNGLVDEGCACNDGQVHFCFPGDPSYRGTPGCFDGVESCNELGFWGACIGGVSAVPPDNCFLNDTSACHAISARPFAAVDLRTGLGTFGQDVVPGSESFAVTCPTGVSQCPSVTAPSTFKPLQSGEYSVLYTKKIADDAGPVTCSFPLFVGAPGLRIELSWEHHLTDDGVDLDVHVHEPGNLAPWNETAAGRPEDCGWANCVARSFEPPGNPTRPTWFADPPAIPPTPVNWWLDTTEHGEQHLLRRSAGCGCPLAGNRKGLP